MAISMAISILSFIAITTADECSAALPMMGTTMSPTKSLDMPSASTVGSSAPTRISLM